MSFSTAASERWSRRRLLFAATATLLSSTGDPGWANVARHPDWLKVEAGDLLWPAKPGDRILFGQGEAVRQEQEWLRGRQVLADKLRSLGKAEDLAAAERLLDFDFEQFSTLYHENLLPSEARPFGAGGDLRVGHVALVDVDAAGQKWIIEAMPNTERQYETIYRRFPGGVIRTKLEAWTESHRQFHIWHGRVQRPLAERAQIAVSARQHVGRDYWFWNLDLADPSAFYCSKLVWLSIRDATNGWPVDGNAQTKRAFWLSPKQLLLAPNISKLHSPAPYGG